MTLDELVRQLHAIDEQLADAAEAGSKLFPLLCSDAELRHYRNAKSLQTAAQLAIRALIERLGKEGMPS